MLGAKRYHMQRSGLDRGVYSIFITGRKTRGLGRIRAIEWRGEGTGQDEATSEEDHAIIRGLSQGWRGVAGCDEGFRVSTS